MRIACWVPKSTSTLSDCVILMAFSLHQCLHECASILRLCIQPVLLNIKTVLFTQQAVGFKRLDVSIITHKTFFEQSKFQQHYTRKNVETETFSCTWQTKLQSFSPITLGPFWNLILRFWSSYPTLQLIQNWKVSGDGLQVTIESDMLYTRMPRLIAGATKPPCLRAKLNQNINVGNVVHILAQRAYARQDVWIHLSTSWK